LIACIGLGYAIYQSVTGPIQFKKAKEERFAKVVSTLKDIKNSQEAYKTVTGKYANDFTSLIKFVENGKYTITQQRDSSFMQFDETYKIDLLKEVKIIDTLGFVSVRDSLFKKDDRYKTMMNVPGAKNGEKFTVSTSGNWPPIYDKKKSK